MFDGKKLLQTMSILQKGWLYLLIQGIFIRHKSGHIDIRNWFSLLNSNFNIITQNRSLGTRGEIALWRIPQNLTDEKSTSAKLIITRTSQWARWASQITSLTIVYSTIYSGTDQSRHQSSASLALCGEFTAQMASNAENVSFDDVIMNDLVPSSKKLLPEPL